MITLLTVIFIGQLSRATSYHLSTMAQGTPHTPAHTRSMITLLTLIFIRAASYERQESYHLSTVMAKAHHTHRTHKGQ
jgi:hypothetical protein